MTDYVARYHAKGGIYDPSRGDFVMSTICEGEWDLSDAEYDRFKREMSHELATSNWFTNRREQFAMAAMQGILSNPISTELRESQLAECAVKYADELIKELDKWMDPK